MKERNRTYRPKKTKRAIGISGSRSMPAAGQISRSLGLMPCDSSLRLGPDYAWTLATLANRPADLAWIAAALLFAAIAGR